MNPLNKSSIVIAIVWFVITMTLAPSACRFDPSGIPGVGGDSGPPPTDGQADRAEIPDGDLDSTLDDASDEGPPPPCTNGEFECNADGSARYCDGDQWVSLGQCFMGCDQGNRICRVPSNVDVDSLQVDESSLGDLDLSGHTNVEIDTDNGRVWDTDTTSDIRPGGVGSILSGVGFYHQSQSGGPDLGIFVVRDFIIQVGTRVEVFGDPALVILATRNVTINGILDAGGWAQAGGPGGYNGGDADTSGNGQCPGLPGLPEASCVHICASGSGGGGFGGAGGTGGLVDCIVGNQIVLAGGAGGGPCGNEPLSPLFGGSGGGGGVWVRASSVGGPGGGGGGAVQISARSTISIGPGGITVPGDGGGVTDHGGGPGGGAGGAVLLEADQLTTVTATFLTANGGGGGSGDCS